MKAGFLNKLRSGISSFKGKYMRYDRIGPPDKSSNLRPIEFAIQENESDLEKELRQFREETQKWHQEFWARHIDNFNRSKQQFVDLNSKDGADCLSSSEMSVFYKKFLDDNYDLFKKYNSEWYGKNAKILWLTVKVSTQRLWPGKQT